MKRTEALDRAKAVVTERNKSYGEPEDNFQRIANRWNAHLANIGLLADLNNAADDGLSVVDVAIMMTDVKMARLAVDATKADSWIDGAGYMACGAEVSGVIEELPKIDLGAEDQTPPKVRHRTFMVGDEVNLKYSEPGSNPGNIIEIDARGDALVRWVNGASGTFPVRLLRHGP